MQWCSATSGLNNHEDMLPCTLLIGDLLLLHCGVQGGNDVQILVDKKWKLPDGVTCERCVLQVTPLYTGMGITSLT